jgi:hypothetical protein
LVPADQLDIRRGNIDGFSVNIVAGRMTAKRWARSVPARGRAPRPAGSFGVALAMARETWDGLTGRAAGPGPTLDGGAYSETAAAAILALTVALWADTAARLGELEGDADG